MTYLLSGWYSKKTSRNFPVIFRFLSNFDSQYSAALRNKSPLGFVFFFQSMNPIVQQKLCISGQNFASIQDFASSLKN